MKTKIDFGRNCHTSIGKCAPTRVHIKHLQQGNLPALILSPQSITAQFQSFLRLRSLRQVNQSAMFCLLEGSPSCLIDTILVHVLSMIG